jgi:hypothetical protein
LDLKETPARPDGILLVVAYLFTLGAGFLGGALFLMAAALPAASRALDDTLFRTSAAVLILLTIVFLLAGVWLLRVALRLWRAQPNNRPAAAVSSAALTIVSLLSIPTFFIAYDGGALLTATVALALLLAAASAASFWYLTRPHVRAYLD